jgi:outer membrane cobalamin receptor
VRTAAAGAWLAGALSVAAGARGEVAEAAPDGDGPSPVSDDDVAGLEELDEDGIPEVVVEAISEADERRRSAEAVEVVDTYRAQRESADLGMVLSRVQGVRVQRSGGLGSSTRFSLNGFTEDQIRFFLDGVPLEFAGFPQGLENVPVNLVERVEIYRGVVPVRFGADALGGAFNLVTDANALGSALGASYQVGSFGTHRATLSARHQFEPLGFNVSVVGYLDRAENDYLVDVLVPSEEPETLGQLVPARVRRFNDRYRAVGGSVQLGFVGQPWADHLLLRVFGSGYEQDLQSNLTMTVPYGEVEFGEVVRGATLRYDHLQLTASHLALDAVVGYSEGTLTLLDLPGRAYDWFGRRTRDTGPGELGPGSDLHFGERRAIGRINLEQPLSDTQSLRLSVAPSYFNRNGENRLLRGSSERDPASVERALVTLVSGIEHTLHAFDARLENTAFVKDYLYRANGERQLTGGLYVDVDRSTHTQALGDAARFQIVGPLLVKVSYEYTSRLPDPDEVFGTGVTVVPNLDLTPETSHNGNLGLQVGSIRGVLGAVRSELNAFYRSAKDMIVLLPTSSIVSTFQNVNDARSAGLEGAASWTSPGQHLELDANATWMDFRNTASEGPFAAFRGDRIPNHPWLFANVAARLRFMRLSGLDDELSLGWSSRYMHAFYRGWESAGRREDKQIIEAQLLQSAALTYLLRSDWTVTTSFEVDNLTDAKAFDFFGAQKPGRAFSFKGTVEW